MQLASAMSCVERPSTLLVEQPPVEIASIDSPVDSPVLSSPSLVDLSSIGAAEHPATSSAKTAIVRSMGARCANGAPAAEARRFRRCGSRVHPARARSFTVGDRGSSRVFPTLRDTLYSPYRT